MPGGQVTEAQAADGDPNQAVNMQSCRLTHSSNLPVTTFPNRYIDNSMSASLLQYLNLLRLHGYSVKSKRLPQARQ